MKGRSILFLSAGCGVSLVFFVLLTILFVPITEVKAVLTRALAREGYEVRVDDFQKSFPLGIYLRNAEVRDGRGLLLKLDTATVRLKLLPLFVGTVSLDARARIGDGELSASFEPRTATISLHSENLRLQDVPLLQIATNADMQGKLFVDGSFTSRGNALQGDMRMEIKQAELRGIKVSGMPLPDASYDTIRGMFRASGGRGSLESLTFQGDGIYIRLKGTVAMTGPLPSAPLDLTIELMPKPDFLEKQKLVFLLLEKYQKSPGAYQIPVAGTLTSPSLQ